MEDIKVIKKYYIRINSSYLKKIEEFDYFDMLSEEDFKTRKEYEDYLFKETTTKDLKYEANPYGNGLDDSQLWSLQKYDIEIHKFFGKSEKLNNMEDILNHFKNIFTTYSVNVVEVTEEIIKKTKIRQIT